MDAEEKEKEDHRASSRRPSGSSRQRQISAVINTKRPRVSRSGGGGGPRGVLDRFLLRELRGHRAAVSLGDAVRPVQVKYSPLWDCSEVLLGFSALGSWLWGYSNQISETGRPELLLEARKFDPRRPASMERVMAIPLVRWFGAASALADIMVPITCVDFAEAYLLLDANEPSDGGVNAAQRHSVRAFVTQQGSPLENVEVDVAVKPPREITSLTGHHIFADLKNNTEFCFAVDQSDHLYVSFISLDSELSFMTCPWWYQTRFAKLYAPSHLRDKINPSFYLLEAEDFLKDQLSRQLKKTLVNAPKPNGSLEEGTFYMLDYTIRFIRFLSTRSFEFVTVAEVQLDDEENPIFVALVGQITPKAYRLVSILRTRRSAMSSTAVACDRMVAMRRRPYSSTPTVVMSNEAVFIGEPVQCISNPWYPCDIVI